MQQTCTFKLLRGNPPNCSSACRWRIPPAAVADSAGGFRRIMLRALADSAGGFRQKRLCLL